MDPVRTPVERHPEGAAVCDTAAADVVRRLDEDIAFACRSQAFRGGDSGSAGANDDGVKVTRAKGRGGRASPRKYR